MPAQALPREHYVALYGEDWDKPASPMREVNLDEVIALYEPLSLPWYSEEYSVAVIPWLEGLRLSKLLAILPGLMSIEKPSPDELDRLETLVADGMDRMWRLLEPRPPVNPFLRASLPEVGALLGFFLVCQKLQAVSGPGPADQAHRSIT